jgi:hypothetical protein
VPRFPGGVRVVLDGRRRLHAKLLRVDASRCRRDLLLLLLPAIGRYSAGRRRGVGAVLGAGSGGGSSPRLLAAGLRKTLQECDLDVKRSRATLESRWKGATKFTSVSNFVSVLILLLGGSASSIRGWRVA